MVRQERSSSPSLLLTIFALDKFTDCDIHSSHQALLFLFVPGTKTVADISDGTCEPGLSPPSSCMNSIPVLHLIEDLRLALEMLALPQEREALLSQIPGPTAAYIKEWFEDRLVSVGPWPDKGIVGHIIMQQWNVSNCYP